MGQKLGGGLCPFLGGELGPHLTQCGQGRSLPPCQVAYWYIQPFGHNRPRPKIGGCALWGRSGSPSNNVHGSRSTSLPSGILIHPALLATTGVGENWGLCPFFERGGGGSPYNTTSRGLRFIPEPSGILIHLAVWPQQTWAKNWVGAVPFFWRELGPHKTQSRLGQGLPPYEVAS